MANGDAQELADLEEVILALVKAKGLTEENFERMRLVKRKDRGEFEAKVDLVKLEE